MLEDTLLQTMDFGLLYQFTLVEIFVNMFCNLVITDFYDLQYQVQSCIFSPVISFVNFFILFF